MIKKFRVTVDGHAYDVTVEMPDESPAPVQAANPLPGSTAPAAPSVPPPAPLAPPPAPPTAAEARPAGPTVAGTVASPLAGRVTAVVVTAGQDVKAGEHLLTLEAMKMNTFIFAPHSGKVAEIKVLVGDAVAEGQALVTIHAP